MTAADASGTARAKLCDIQMVVQALDGLGARERATRSSSPGLRLSTRVNRVELNLNTHAT